MATDIDQMTDAEVVAELSASTRRSGGVKGWELNAGGNYEGRIRFSVAGEVAPFKGNGERVQRGRLPFFGDGDYDAHRALRSGLAAMRAMQESRR